MALALRSIGLVGTLVFACAFALTFLSPIHYERAARGFLEQEIEQKLRDGLEILAEGAREGRLARLAEAMFEKNCWRHPNAFCSSECGPGLSRPAAALIVTPANSQPPG